MLRGVSRPRALIVVGADAHTDRWHDLAATGAAAAAVLAERYEVGTTTTSELAGVSDAHLIVVDASGNLDADVTDSRAVVDALVAAHTAGTALLALHSSANAFRDDPRWSALLGGRWVPEVSGHPPIGDATVRFADGAPFGAGSFGLFDERYTGLERHPDTLLVAQHTETGASHPLVWARDPDGGGRVVYSALGHDTRSYDSPGHRRLLADAITWLLLPREGSYPGAYPA